MARRRHKKDNTDNSPAVKTKAPSKHPVLASYLKRVVSELSLGNYELAMIAINEGMSWSDAYMHEGNQDYVVALLELKNIVARLRLKCESPEELIGPTIKSNALPLSFSIEMLDLVQKVLRCHNHYEVLRISHHATYSEVKRAYKRLALRLHPDKNTAPGAEEAFRRINEATDTLTDNQKRTEYNMLTAVGDYGASRSSLYDNYHESVQTQMEMEMSATEDEQLEEEVYGDQLQMSDLEQQPRRTYQPANQRVPQRQPLYQTEQLVIGLVAALVFIMITLHYLANAPEYSLTPSSTHTVRLVSRLNNLPYFVTPQLAASQTQQQQLLLEREIEEIYLNDLKHNCRQERKMRDKLLQRSRLANNRNLQEQALNMPTPACHALGRLDELKYKPQLMDNNSESK